MSLFATLRNASGTSQTISSALRVISNNIAGANDEHYDRQIYSFRSDAHVDGVSLNRIIRATVPLLEQIELHRRSDTGEADVINQAYQQLSRIQGLTDSEKPILVKLAEDFIKSWHEYHQNPSSPQSQSEVVRRAELMASELGRISQEIADLKLETQRSAERDIDRTNTLLQNIQEANERVAAIRGSGESSSSVESQRDALIQELASIIRIQVFDRGNGQVAIYAAGDRAPQVNPQFTGHNANRLVDRGFSGRFFLDQSGGLRLSGLPNEPDDALWLNDDQNFRLPSGTLLGKLNLLRDNIVEQDTSIGLFRRLEDQLDAFASLWTQQPVGNAETFASVYDSLPTSGVPPVPPEIDTEFFVAPPANQQTGRFNLQVNPDLLNAPYRLKRIDLHLVVELFSRAEITLQTLDTATNIFQPTLGLDARSHNWRSRTYLEVITDLTNHWARNINDRQDSFQFQQRTLDTLSESIKSQTGVNIDEELADMTVLQNTYAANARVLRTAKEMLDALLAI